ncbi:MAG: 3-dehydroquinate synthase family protein [Bdellovibrionota bacterium]
MTKKTHQKLKVHWMDTPLEYQQEGSFCWASLTKSAAYMGKNGEKQWSSDEKSAQRKIEKLLDWPSGTISVFQQAFHLGLDRFTGWDLSAVGSEKKLASYVTAASVYKRGVATSQFTKPTKKKSLKGQYDIVLSQDLSAIDKRLDEADFIVVDHNVERAWPHLEDFRHLSLGSVSEVNKNLQTVATILQAWKQAGAKKRWVAIGGGITTDLVGFAAYLAQASIVMVPTTVLAMVDASVGGKTGTNFPPYGKNQIGAFYFPREVILWSGWLITLTERHIKSGGSECIKHCLLVRNKNLTKRLVKALAEVNLEEIADFLPELVAVKSNIVSEDAKETGKRAILNLGHTLAHALEAVSHHSEIGVYKTIEHGEAVGLGLFYATILSHHLGLMEKSDQDYILNILIESRCLISKAQLRSCLGVKALNSVELWKHLEEALLHDKKQKDQKGEFVRFVLLKKSGVVCHDKKYGYTIPVACSDLHKAWQKFIKLLPHQ